MANANKEVQESSKVEQQGKLVQDVNYEFPDNGWIVQQIAPIPEESQFVVDGKKITHLVRGGPFFAKPDMVMGIGQKEAFNILAVARGEKVSPRYEHVHRD